ncbi:MAG: Sua5/YciO/YrdC/YwlC family protein [Gammaproteobacteria bacterium]
MTQASVHPWKLREAARCFHQGGILAYPTEAVFGLGCDPLNWYAVQRLLAIKHRPLDKGLILIAADYNQLLPFIRPLSSAQMQPLFDSWPGPTTWLLPAADGLPFWLRGRHETVAVRVTKHPVAATLSLACNSPLVSTSANISTRNPAANPTQVRDRLVGMADCIIHGQTGGSKTPSVIRDAESGVIIRG